MQYGIRWNINENSNIGYCCAFGIRSINCFKYNFLKKVCYIHLCLYCKPSLMFDLDSWENPLHIYQEIASLILWRCQKSKVQSAIWTWHLSGDKHMRWRMGRGMLVLVGARGGTVWRHIHWTLNQVVKRLGQVFGDSLFARTTQKKKRKTKIATANNF